MWTKANLEVDIDGERVRAYRTGNRVRYRPTDGQLEFIGRIDRQIKIRGQRIEIPEVEHAILGHESVRDAAVVVHERKANELEMVGYVTIRDARALQWNESEAQVDTWAAHFDKSLYANVDSIDALQVGRDFLGWKSMYDGNDIDKVEMEEWLDDTMDTVLDGRAPAHVLEIGTGTGMVLFNLGEELQSYVGIEPSRSAAAFVAHQAQSVPRLAPELQIARLVCPISVCPLSPSVLRCRRLVLG
ncbi:hypothetical protein CKM354_000632500 [Cercospora kikuchii]|uniref:Uncharacterized protein n=1 Tax=Cercospora kikuchii TaxID=84275 RepID=A0A9P3CHQ2_9PEZI|nr:uncharacterized protein CKM354_000632500 [Cercospora kikuchii]GIZ43084.1 hypothetical protein CKM354_000632500 [Cercospora kikuchii]